jgi:hypothetical protein
MMLILCIVLIFLLGWPFEWPAIVLVFLPIFYPVVKALDFNMVWFGALVAVTLQTAFLSPPVAMSAYYLKQVVRDWSLGTIYRGMFEFMGLQVIAIAILISFPQVATWLPEKLNEEFRAIKVEEVEDAHGQDAYQTEGGYGEALREALEEARDGYEEAEEEEEGRRGSRESSGERRHSDAGPRARRFFLLQPPRAVRFRRARGSSGHLVFALGALCRPRRRSALGRRHRFSRAGLRARGDGREAPPRRARLHRAAGGAARGDHGAHAAPVPLAHRARLDRVPARRRAGTAPRRAPPRAPGRARAGAAADLPPLQARRHACAARARRRAARARAAGRWVLDEARLAAPCGRTRGCCICAIPRIRAAPSSRVPSSSRLAAFAARHDLVVCADEIHADLLLDAGKPHVPIASLAPEMCRRTVTLASPNKTFNFPGAGCAWAIIEDEALRREFSADHHATVHDPSVFGYIAALAAYREGEPWLAAQLDYLRGNRDLVERAVGRMPGLAMAHVEATYLAWIDATALGVADAHAHFLACGVALSPGEQFGAPGYVRLNFGTQRARLEAARAHGFRRRQHALEVRIADPEHGMCSSVERMYSVQGSALAHALRDEPHAALEIQLAHELRMRRGPATNASARTLRPRERRTGTSFAL